MLHGRRYGICLLLDRHLLGSSPNAIQLPALGVRVHGRGTLAAHLLQIPMKILDIPRSGSYQGLTSSRNRFGQYVRTRAIPVNPSSSFQAAVRGRMSTNAVSWKLLTAVQKEGWVGLGAQIQRTDSLGQYYDLTGFQAYCLVNNNKLAAGDAVVSDAPAYAIPTALSSITPTITAAAVSVA